MSRGITLIHSEAEVRFGSVRVRFGVRTSDLRQIYQTRIKGLQVYSIMLRNSSNIFLLVSERETGSGGAIQPLGDEISARESL